MLSSEVHGLRWRDQIVRWTDGVLSPWRESNYRKFLIEGVAGYEPVGRGMRLSTLDPDNVERIEICPRPSRFVGVRRRHRRHQHITRADRSGPKLSASFSAGNLRTLDGDARSPA